MNPHPFWRHILPCLLLALMHAVVQADEQAATIAGVEARLPVDSRFVGVTGDLQRNAWLTLQNRTDEPRTIRIELTLRGPDQREHPHAQAVNLAPRAGQRIPIPSPLLQLFGLHTVRFRLLAGDDASAWAADTLAVYPKNTPARRGESVFPVGFASGASRCTPNLLALAASLGFEFHRFEPGWGRVQPRPDVWNWESVDQYMDLIERHGMRPQPLTLGSARWAAESPRHAPRLDAWSAWMAALAKRYQGRVEFWEIWNEPDITFFLGTVEEYTALQRAAFDAIKSVAPNEIVTSGGFADMSHGSVKPGIFEAALRDYPRAFDWFAYHKHGHFNGFFADLHVQLPALQQRTGAANMPIVFTETGMDTRQGQRYQATTLTKKMAYAASIGAKGYVWYNLMDRAGSAEANRPGYTYGLLTNPTGTGNFSAIEGEIRPKEAFVAAAVAVRELRARPRLATWAQDGRRFAFLFGRPADHLLVGWTEDARSPESIWIVETPAERITRLDLFGNASDVPIVQNRALIALADEPQYHQFLGGAATPSLVAPLVTVPDRITPGAAGEVVVQLEVRNPLDREVRVAAEISAPNFQIPAPPPAQTIAPGGTALFPIRLATSPGRFGEIRPFDVTFRFDGLPWAPTMRIPVTFNAIRAAQGHRLALRDLQQVTNKHEHDPHTVRLMWASASDLSVQAEFGADPKEDLLRLRLDVTDNRHEPVRAEAPILDGDAVEIGWATAAGAAARLEVAASLAGPARVEAHGRGIPRPRTALRSVNIAREGNRTAYDLTLDLKQMGLERQDLDNGFGFNFAVHDNDGEGPKCWMSPMPGLGGDKNFNPGEFPRLHVRPNPQEKR